MVCCRHASFFYVKYDFLFYCSVPMDYQVFFEHIIV